MDSNMILMITLAVVLMLVFYKPEQKIEGFDATSNVWSSATLCGPTEIKCNSGDGFRCITPKGILATENETGRCLKCKNNNDLTDPNTAAGSLKCALGPVPFACPECDITPNN